MARQATTNGAGSPSFPWIQTSRDKCSNNNQHASSETRRNQDGAHRDTESTEKNDRLFLCALCVSVGSVSSVFALANPRVRLIKPPPARARSVGADQRSSSHP